MKNIIIAIVTSLFLFAASAMTSMYLQGTADDNEAASEAVDQPGSETSEQPVVKEKANQMPVPTRPDQQLTIEAVLQMSESAKLRQAKLDEFEKLLKKEEQRIKLLFEDLKREKKELATFSLGVESKVVALDEMTVQMTELLGKIETEKTELADLKKKSGVASDKSSEIQGRVAEIKSWVSGLEAKQVADIVVQKSNSGDMEFAAELLHSLPDRQKAKVLLAINDPVLVNQLIDSLKIKPKEEK